ncbi:MAG TPA: hypothetical protein VFQ78_04525 [Candidatus Udaeobacter sp.]|nr:hypothetical protein [Candidatus Udaeobacter sp.]
MPPLGKFAGCLDVLDMTEGVFEDRRLLWAIAALIVILFTAANLPWQLDDYDQAKQAFTSFEMVKEGHWFYQRTPHEGVATKPPLVGWISVAVFAVTRSWEIAWRFPSLVAALALAIVLFRAARNAYGDDAALIALAAFGFNLLSPRLATLVRTDMPLALVVFLIGLLTWQKIRARTGWALRDQIHIFVLLTASMLIKGPIVYAFLLPGILVFEWHCRTAPPRGAPKQHSSRAWAGWWPWVASLVIFLLWVAGGIWSRPGFYQEVVMREFIGRFGETIHRPQPLFFYFPHLLHKFAPWSVLMIFIAAVDLRSQKWRVRGAFREMAPETFWLLCWSIGGLLVMSLIPSKRVDRIFPVIPPLCLLLAAQISATCAPLPQTASSGIPGVRRLYLWTLAALGLGILITGGYTGWKIVTGYRDHRDALAVFGKTVRDEAQAHHWRCQIVTAKDEGLLLYLREMYFIAPADAVAEWKAGNLDALVASEEKAAALMPDLKDAAFSELQSNESREQEQGRGYVLITHQP